MHKYFLRNTIIILINIKVNFIELEPFKKTYNLIKVISTKKQVDLIKKKKFLDIALEIEEKTHLINIVSFFNFELYITLFL